MVPGYKQARTHPLIMAVAHNFADYYGAREDFDSELARAARMWTFAVDRIAFRSLANEYAGRIIVAVTR